MLESKGKMFRNVDPSVTSHGPLVEYFGSPWDTVTSQMVPNFDTFTNLTPASNFP